MSLFLPLSDLSTRCPASDIHDMETQLTVSMESTKPTKRPVSFFGKTSIRQLQAWSTCVVHGQSLLCVPFFWGMLHPTWGSWMRSYRTPRQQCASLPSSRTFLTTLRPEQMDIYHESVRLIHQQQGSVLWSVYPGGGKTMTSLYFASQIGLRTLVLTHRLVLIDQWIESLQRCFGSSLTYVVIDPSRYKQGPLPVADVYVVNALNVPKWSADEWATLRIGTVIVDECHVMVTSVFVRALSCVSPRYMLGLSATPYRPDGLTVLLDYYFGRQHVVRTLSRPHRVLYYTSPWSPPDQKDRRGQRLWDPVLDFQATCPERQAYLVSIMMHPCFFDRHMLILCKRKKQIIDFHQRLLHEGVSPSDITTLYGSQTTFDRNAKYVLASFQKVGVGFSHDILDMLILTTDCEEYFLQYLGRVFRRPDVEPLIVDVVDRHPVLQRHFRTRKRIYQECGGQLESLSDYLHKHASPPSHASQSRQEPDEEDRLPPPSNIQ